MRSRAQLCFLILVLASAPLSVFAGDPQADRLKMLYDRGSVSYASGDFKTALSSFEEAYRLRAEPRFLFNIGQCHRKLGNVEQARSAYQKYLQIYPDTPHRAFIQGWLSGTKQSEPPKVAEEKQPTCSDGVKNGAEADVDCGAGGCARCAVGKACAGDAQCESGSCQRGVCVKVPVWKKSWFWGVAGGVVALGAAAGIGAGVTAGGDAPHGPDAVLVSW